MQRRWIFFIGDDNNNGKTTAMAIAENHGADAQLENLKRADNS